MWTSRFVGADEEMTIDYAHRGVREHVTGTRENHDAGRAQFMWTCECTDAYIAEAPDREYLSRRLGFSFKERDRSFIIRCIDRYLQTASAQATVMTHELGRHGLFRHRDQIVVFASSDAPETIQAPSLDEVALSARRIQASVQRFFDSRFE